MNKFTDQRTLYFFVGLYRNKSMRNIPGISTGSYFTQTEVLFSTQLEAQ